jgi:hypothetical protein
MEDNLKKCPYCGKELPVEVEFCPYCIHKLSDVKTISTAGKRKNIRLWLPAAVLLCMVCLAVGAAFVHKMSETGNKVSSQISDTHNDYGLGMKASQWSRLKDDVSLTEQQQLATKYYDNNYMSAFSYEFLIRYPDIFEDMQVKFNATVEKVVSMDFW